MTGYLNEYEVEDCVRIFSHFIPVPTPNLHTGALVIEALMDWTNRHSDGWAYWQKPRQAATRLITVLDESRRVHLRGNHVADISDAELKVALVPIKSFLSKRNVDYNADLPWAAILPVYAPGSTLV